MREARDELVTRTLGVLMDGSTSVAAALVGLALDPDAAPAARVSAARAVLELGNRWHETGELAERLAALEDARAAA